jgi:predicted metal-dependent hydrolase
VTRRLHASSVFRRVSTARGDIDYELISAPRRRTLGLVVYADGRVAVRAPRGTAPAAADEMVRAHADWVARQRLRFASRPQQASARWAHGEMVLLHGAPLALALREGGRASVERGDAHLLVTLPDPADPARVQALVLRWYRREAERVFALRLALCAAGLPWPVAAPPLRIRHMKARWGSCARSGAITLNLRLMQAPISLLDYVIVHELCHLWEMNHSPAYYARLEQALPGWRAQRAALRTTRMTW